MDLKLKGKSVLITGAGSQIGYGRTTAINLAREGCDVAVVDINIEGAKQTAQEIQKMGGKSIAVQIDVRDRTQVENGVKEIISTSAK
jgi:NAD(P)-dependent dehydrogenase (short-subunit alcohol dehydrogenase family)